jgi:N-acetylglucosaminyl-diphospho-decaprenol L-rhamnosyltransferase
MKKIVIVIVSYNVKYYLEQCLNSLKRSIKDIDSDIYVVDNHSRDGSVDYLKKRFSSVKFISSNHNLGFARANNIAIRQSESEYVLLLNPDTIVGENTITYALSFMDEHEKAGGLGVKMLKCDGSSAMESRRGLPTPMTSLYKMCNLCTCFPNNHRFGRYYMSYLPWNEPARIEVISGAFFMLRREALEKIGLLDEDFFMYGEDIDLSYRLLKGGYENWYLPENILHYKGESTQKSSFRYVHVFYEAMLIFFRKHYGNLSFWISIPIKLAIYMKATLALIKMQTSVVRKTLGFISPKRDREPDYVFIGSETMIEQCRRLVRDKGLSGSFYIGDEETRPNGHLDLIDGLEKKIITYIVYDTDAYSYESIMKIFATTPVNSLKIGTYNRKTRSIITAEEIIK